MTGHDPDRPSRPPRRRPIRASESAWATGSPIGGRMTDGRSVSASPPSSVPSRVRKARWSGRWPGVARAVRRPSPSPTAAPSPISRDRPRQVRAAARSGHDRGTRPGVELLGSGSVARVDMGQRDRHDPPAGATDLGFDRVEEGLAGIARVDHDDVAPTDEHGVGRPAVRPERALTGHDREPGRDPLGPDRQVGDEGQAGPGSPRTRPPARSAGGWSRSAATSGSSRRPSGSAPLEA